MFVEIAVQTPEEARVAFNAGADRVELCTALTETGGLTPSSATIARTVACASEVGKPVHVLVRPRAGGFVYGDEDVATMVEDIRHCAELGVQGVVVGAATLDGSLALTHLARLVDAARQHPHPLEVVLHRVFDTVVDQQLAIRHCADLGIGTILTSGGAQSAVAGAARLGQLRQCADALGVTLLAGGGVRSTNVAQLVAMSGVSWVHSSCAMQVASAGAAGPGGGAASFTQLDCGQLRALLAAAHAVSGTYH